MAVSRWVFILACKWCENLPDGRSFILVDSRIFTPLFVAVKDIRLPLQGAKYGKGRISY